MLKTMRKNVKALAPTLWIVIATFIISIFAIWGGAGRLGEKSQSDRIATVGGEPISTDTYYRTLRNRLESLQKQLRALNRSFIQQLNVPQQVLEQLIQQSLLLQKARQMRITASDAEVRDRIVSLFQRDGKFIGFDEYRQILEYNRTSVGAFENELKREIILSKFIEVLTAGVAAPPEALWEYYKKQNESAKIEYLVLEEGKMPSVEAMPESELRAHFEGHKDKYILPERRSGVYVFLRLEDIKKEVQVTDAEVEKHYRDNLDQFKEPERVRVSRIYLALAGAEKAAVQAEAAGLLERLRKGEDFGGLARSHSKDDKAKEGGDWGFDEWRGLPEAERDEVDKLAAGELSGVVETSEGFSILKVTEKTAARTQPLDEVKARVKSTLEDQKARETASRRIAQLEKSARREKSLDVAAQKSDLKVRETGLLKEGQELEDFDPAGSISQALFGLKEKEISSAVHIITGTGIVQLEKIEASRPATFEEVKTEVEADAKAGRQKQLALEKIRLARPQVEGAKNWEELAPKLGLEYKSADEHKKEQYLGTIGESPEIDRLAFSLPLNQISDPVEFPTGYAFLRVLERKEASLEEFEKNKETEKGNFLETEKNRCLQAYVDKLRQEMKVKVNFGLFTQVNEDVLSRFEGAEE